MKHLNSRELIKVSSGVDNINGKRVHTIEQEIPLDVQVYVEALIDGEQVLYKKSESWLSPYMKRMFFYMSRHLNYPASPDEGSHLYIKNMDGTLRVGDSTYHYLGSGFKFNTFATSGGANAGILVGFNDSGSGYIPAISDTVVGINDYNLRRIIPHGTVANQLSYAQQAFGNIGVAGNEASFKITRNFTGNSVGSVLVKETGLARSTGMTNTLPYSSLCLRDILGAGITVAAGKILTLNYIFKIKLLPEVSPVRGLLKQFIDLTFRTFSDTSIPCSSISGGSASAGFGEYNFHCGMGGGFDSWSFTNMNVLASNQEESGAANLGIVVGISNAEINILQVALNTKIKHGYTDGKLVHYGNIVDKYITNTGDNTAQYEIWRIFENAGSIAVNVNEIGLYCLGADTATVHCIYREVLATTKVIPAGELLRVKYLFKITA